MCSFLLLIHVRVSLIPSQNQKPAADFGITEPEQRTSMRRQAIPTHYIQVRSLLSPCFRRGLGLVLSLYVLEGQGKDRRRWSDRVVLPGAFRRGCLLRFPLPGDAGLCSTSLALIGTVLEAFAYLRLPFSTPFSHFSSRLMHPPSRLPSDIPNRNRAHRLQHRLPQHDAQQHRVCRYGDAGK